MIKFTPTIDDHFERFFADERIGLRPAAARRLDLVRAHLEGYLDEHGYRILTTGQLVVLHIERQLAPHGAFVRTMHADDLLFALPGYLDPAHRLPTPTDAKAQVQTVRNLVRFLWNVGAWGAPAWGDDDYSCAVLELEGALRAAGRTEPRAPAAPK